MSKFDKNVFISYAHLDNQPLDPEQQGWITRFHGKLEALLSMRIGEPAKIWRDDRLRGDHVFANEIVDQFDTTALLISIVTPRYAKSDWCAREVQEFCQRAEQSGGVKFENVSRVLKVVKTPVDPAEEPLPVILDKVLGFEFFKYGEVGEPIELDPLYGKELEPAFNLKVKILVEAVYKQLKTLNRLKVVETSGRVEDAGAPAKATVYLAECSYDRKETREILEGDLQNHGYTVLPDRPLPRDEADYIAAVQSLLERCALSIHLVGDIYGGVPDGPSQKSVVVLQNELAVERSKSGALPRVIWLPEETHSDKSDQQTFIEALHQDADIQFGADLMTGDLETLRSTIHAALKKLEKPEPTPAEAQAVDADADADVDASANGARQIYLIFDAKDRKATVPVRKFLRDQGFDVVIPAFDDEAAAVREVNRQSMSECDAVILFYGSGGDAWKLTRDNELRKMPAYRKGKPLLASYTYLAAPKTPSKEDLIDMGDSPLIDGLEGFSVEAMGEFMQAMNAASTTP